ncbi:MAG: hypothetical protein HQ541_02125 [Mariniphaga sp.]|nr:hypothetical protein [Mariniphaga sp.]
MNLSGKIKKVNKQEAGAYLLLILLFIVSFVLYGFIADYVLFYQEKDSLFIFSTNYLQTFLDRPGGLLEYSGDFLTTFYYKKILGAFLLSMIIFLIVFYIQKIVSSLSQSKIFHFLPIAVGGVLILLQSDYHFEAYTHIGVLIVVSLFYYTIRYSSKLKGFFPVIIFPILFYLIGGFALIYGIMVIFWIAITAEIRKKILLPIAFLIEIITVVFVSKEYLFYITQHDILLAPLPFFSESGILKPVILLVLLLAIIPLAKFLKPIKIEKKKFANAFFRFGLPLLVLTGIISGITKNINQNNIGFFKVEKMYFDNQLGEMIRYNQRNPSSNLIVNYYNNLALSETGQLCSRMFSFPQNSNYNPLFLTWETKVEIFKRGGYFYYNLGLINEAHRWAYEAMVMNGYTPEIMKMLIKTDLINGNFNTAEKYINILKRTIYYRDDALYYERMLNDNALLAKDKELGSKKQIKLEDDFFILSKEPEANIDYVLHADSLNKIALEYKFANLMLKNDVESIIKLLPSLEKCGYSAIPKHIDEAVTAYKLLNVGEVPELKKLKISVDAEQRFSSYYQVFRQYNNNLAAAKQTLSRNFSNTYWYYVFYK